MENNGSIGITNQEGKFRLEKADPGLYWIRAYNNSRGQRWLVLLSSPAGIEPIGFTQLTLNLKHENVWNESLDDEPGVNYIDPTPDEQFWPQYDPSAAQLYIFAGYAFVIISLIGFLFAFIGGRSGDPGVLRTASVFGFLTLGYYGT